MNRSLIEGDPHAVLEGMLIAAYAIGASHGYVYIRAEYPLAIERLRSAIAAMTQARAPGRARPGHGLLVRHQAQGGRRRLRLRRGDGADRQHRGTARHAADAAALPRRRRPLGQADHHQQRRDAGDAAGHRRPGGPTGTPASGRRRRRGPRPSVWSARCGAPGSSRCRSGRRCAPSSTTSAAASSRTSRRCRRAGRRAAAWARSSWTRRSTTRAWRPPARSWAPAASSSSTATPASSTPRATSSASPRTSRAASACPVASAQGTWSRSSTGSAPARASRPTSTAWSGSPESSSGARSAALGRRRPTRSSPRCKYFRGEFLEHVVDHRCRAAVCRDLVDYRIIPGKCTGCQRCVQVCPTGAITGPRAELHNLDPEKCIKCRSCYEICRFDAIAGDAIVIESGVEHAD